MEQAGLGLAQAVLQHPDLKRHGLLVLVAPATTAVMAWWWPVNCICADCRADLEPVQHP